MMRLINPIKITLGNSMANGLAAFLRAELTARGWLDSQLADAAGIDRSTLSNIFKNPQSVPKLETLDRLSQALSIPLAKLITVCGYDIDDREDASDNRIAILVNALPELKSVVDDLAQLQAEDLKLIQAYVQGYLQKK